MSAHADRTPADGSPSARPRARGPFWRLARLAALGVGALAWGACAGDPGSSIADAGADNGEADAEESADCAFDPFGYRFCMPEPPQGTPAELCPGGRYGEAGICAPDPPRLLSWSCPDGWLAETVDGFGSGLEEPYASPDVLSYCLPPAPPMSCPPGRMPQVGSAECEPHGSACPPVGEDWPDEASLRARAAGYGGRLL
jgi:hypothetical protein